MDYLSAALKDVHVAFMPYLVTYHHKQLLARVVLDVNHFTYIVIRREFNLSTHGSGVSSTSSGSTPVLTTLKVIHSYSTESTVIGTRSAFVLPSVTHSS